MIDFLGADTDAENAEDDILLDLLMKNVLTEKEYISKKGGVGAPSVRKVPRGGSCISV